MRQLIFRRFLALMLLLACALQGSQPASATAQGDQLRLLNHIGGSFDDIVVQGDYAYATVGTELTILDIRVPAHPVRSGYISIPKLRSTVRAKASVRIAGSYAYVITSDGSLWIADVSVPNRPISAGVYIPPDGSAVDHVSLAGRFAYVSTPNSAGGSAKPQLRILDVSNPAAPIEIGAYTPPGGITLYDLTVAGGYAYLIVDNTLRIVDISKPAAPVEVGRYTAPGDVAGSLAVAGRYAYIATYDAGLHIVDLSRPNHPTEVGAYQEPGINLIGKIVVDGQLVYAISQRLDATNLRVGYELLILDVSRPASPRKAGLYTPPGASTIASIAAKDGYVYVATSEVLRVIQVADPSAPSEIGAYVPIGGSAGDLAADNQYAYISGSGGLTVVDVAHPTAAAMLGRYLPKSGFLTNVVSANHYAYVGQEAQGRAIFLGGSLQIVDVSNPIAPLEAGEFRAGFVTYPAAISGTLVYAVSDSHRIDLLDVSNPSAPKSTGTYTLPLQLYTQRVVPAGRYAYVATDHGLRIVDFANPASPVEVGIYVPLGGDFVGDVAIAGRYMYVSTRQDMRVVDIANRSAPLEVGRYTPPDGAETRRIVQAGRYLYVGTSSGLRVIDSSNPSAPQEVAFAALPFGAGALAVVGHRVYVADGFVGGGWSILWHAAPVAASIPIGGGAQAAPADATQLAFPNHTFAQTTTVTFTAILANDAPATGQLINIGHTFALTGTIDTTSQPVQPTRPYSITIQYNDTERGPAIKSTLALYSWDGGAWVKEPSSTLDVATNTISASPSHFSIWAILGETRHALLPLERR